jgi:glutaredoxin
LTADSLSLLESPTMFGVWKRKSGVPDVILYTKPDCPLCDEAKAYLDELLQTLPFNLTVKDVQSDAKLMALYGERVPLIVVNGREVVGYPPEKKWVKIAIKAGPRLDMRPM